MGFFFFRALFCGAVSFPRLKVFPLFDVLKFGSLLVNYTFPLRFFPFPPGGLFYTYNRLFFWAFSFFVQRTPGGCLHLGVCRRYFAFFSPCWSLSPDLIFRALFLVVFFGKNTNQGGAPPYSVPGFLPRLGRYQPPPFFWFFSPIKPLFCCQKTLLFFN